MVMAIFRAQVNWVIGPVSTSLSTDHCRPRRVVQVADYFRPQASLDGLVCCCVSAPVTQFCSIHLPKAPESRRGAVYSRFPIVFTVNIRRSTRNLKHKLIVLPFFQAQKSWAIGWLIHSVIIKQQGFSIVDKTARLHQNILRRFPYTINYTNNLTFL